jgi:hypothetical protein
MVPVAGITASIKSLPLALHHILEPTIATQDRKNYEILQYLARRPAETALRIGALAGLSASYRDLSVVMDTLHEKDIGGYNFPEIAAQEAANTIKYLQVSSPTFHNARTLLPHHLNAQSSNSPLCLYPNAYASTCPCCTV